MPGFSPFCLLARLTFKPLSVSNVGRTEAKDVEDKNASMTHSHIMMAIISLVTSVEKRGKASCNEFMQHENPPYIDMCSVSAAEISQIQEVRL